jgi:hypothetical protein
MRNKADVRQRLRIYEFTHPKSASTQAVTRCGSNSAIWIAFNAAPFNN